MSYHYGKQKFDFAIKDLVAAGDLRSRVHAAISQHLIHIQADSDLPESARDSFDQFLASLKRDNESSASLTDVINNMPEQEVEKIAQHVVDLYTRLYQTE